MKIKEYKQIILQRLAREYEIEYRRNRNYVDIADMFKLCNLGFLNRGDGKIIVFVNGQVKHIRNIFKRR